MKTYRGVDMIPKYQTTEELEQEVLYIDEGRKVVWVGRKKKENKTTTQTMKRKNLCLLSQYIDNINTNTSTNISYSL